MLIRVTRVLSTMCTLNVYTLTGTIAGIPGTIGVLARRLHGRGRASACVPDSVPLLDSSSLPSLDVLLPLQAEAPGEFVGVSQGGDLREEAEPLVEVGTNTPRLGEVGGERERVEGTYCF